MWNEMLFPFLSPFSDRIRSAEPTSFGLMKTKETIREFGGQEEHAAVARASAQRTTPYPAKSEPDGLTEQSVFILFVCNIFRYRLPYYSWPL